MRFLRKIKTNPDRLTFFDDCGIFISEQKEGENGMLSPHIRIGPRTIKTAAAVIISMVIVHFYGTTTSRLTFAMLGAMAAVEPTFNDSLRSCMAQIVGVLFGSLVGVLLLFSSPIV